MQHIWIAFIFLFVALLLVYPFSFTLQAFIDCFDIRGFYCIKVGFIKVLCGRAKVDETGRILIENKKNNIKRVKVETTPFVEQMGKEVLRVIHAKEFNFYAQIGARNDAFKTCMLASGICVGYGCVYNYFHNKEKGFEGVVQVIPNFEKQVADISTEIKIRFSILSVLVAILRAWVIVRRKKNGKRT